MTDLQHQLQTIRFTGRCVLLTALTALPATAQQVHAVSRAHPPLASWVHEAWTAATGLPVNTVNDVIQSRTGYIWVTTYDGLVRFDGVRFTVYNTTNSPGLTTNRLLSISEGSDGTLWIVNEQYRLTRFRDGRFTLLAADSVGDVQTIVEDRTGRIWVATTKGLAVVRGDSVVPIGRETLSGPILSVIRRHDGSIWAGGRAGVGLYRVASGDRVQKIPVDSSLESGEIQAMHEDSSGTLWIGASHGFWSGRQQFTAVRARVRAPQHVIGLYALHRRGVFALTTQGIYRLTPDPTLTFEPSASLYEPIGWTDGESVWYATITAIFRDGRQVAAIPQPPEYRSSVIATTAMLDREGSIWVGTTAAGLHRLRQSLFTTYSVGEGIANQNVYPVYADRSDDVWVGTWGFGISRIDAKSGQVTTWPRQDAVPFHVYSFLEDRPGRLLIGTYAGLASCTIATMQCGREGPEAMRAGAPIALYQGPRGDVWAGTTVGLWHREDTVWSEVSPAAGAPNAPVRAFAATRDGALWMGTNGAGITRLHDGQFTPVRVADGLPSDLVRALYQDADGWLWVGTEGRGLARLDPRGWDSSGGSRKIVTIGAGDGLYDEAIHQILEDDAGRLWMNTNRGVFWVPRAELIAFADGKTARVHSTSYTERDGLRNREGNGGVQPAGARTRDGRFWLPTQDGVAVVDPARVRRDRVAPPVVVERVVANGAPLDRVGDHVNVRVRQRDLQIEYTALTFLEPANVRFRYRLEPYDADWVDPGNRRTAFYTKVPPGRYTFRVEASNEQNAWNGRSAPLVLSVEPYFYETTLAKSLAALTVGAALLFWIRWRLAAGHRRERELAALVDTRTAALRANEQQLEAQNAQLAVQASKLAELNQVRSRLFANLSHEFRTPLTLILGPLRGLVDGRHGELNAAAREQADLMLRNGQRLLRLINQILDLTKLQAGAVTLDPRSHDLIGFARGVTLAFSPLAERRGIALRFTAQVPELRLTFDPEQLEKVLLNLLSNALKFTTRGGEVEVTVGAQSSGAEMTVRDTGVGIAPNELPRVFERFYQSDSSATRRYEGTGIGLALARELVELHGGTIGVESTLGSGSTFTVKLPLGTSENGVAASPAVPMAHAPTPTTMEASALELATPSAGAPTSPVELADKLPQAGIEPTKEDRTTILIVDDNPDVRAYVRSVLAGTYRVIEAGDGRAGLAATRQMLPDLIVADVMMPEMDGLALGRALKDDAMTDAIPVVLLTARAATEDQIAGYETGADAYLVKPFDPAVLEACVANLLVQRQRLRERFRSGKVRPVPTIAITPERPAIEGTLRPIVETRLTDPDLSPETLAAAAGMSYHQMYRALHELSTTPSRFIRGVRVECAAELLRRGAGSVTEIAYSVGFESLSYFSRAYRERFGVAPSAHVRPKQPIVQD